MNWCATLRARLAMAAKVKRAALGCSLLAEIGATMPACMEMIDIGFLLGVPTAPIAIDHPLEDADVRVRRLLGGLHLSLRAASFTLKKPLCPAYGRNQKTRSLPRNM